MKKCALTVAANNCSIDGFVMRLSWIRITCQFVLEEVSTSTFELFLDF